MRRALTAAVAVLAAMPTLAQGVAATAASTSNILTIPAETEIWLAPLRDISSKHVRQGDAITMQVSRDVFVHRALVIPRGTEASGTIAYRTGKGALGKSAKIEFDLKTLRLAQQVLPISAHYRVAGDGNSAWAVATFLLVSMVGSLFITGHSAVVPAGSEWRATTRAPLQIALDDPALPPRMREAVVQAVFADEPVIPLNSAYAPPPAEIFLRTSPR